MRRPKSPIGMIQMHEDGNTCTLRFVCFGIPGAFSLHVLSGMSKRVYKMEEMLKVILDFIVKNYQNPLSYSSNNHLD